MSQSAEDEFWRPPLPLLCKESDLAGLEVDNGVDLAQYVSSLAANCSGEFRLTPEIVKESNRLAMRGIYACAGEYRDRFRMVGDHVPPKWSDIPRQVEVMCDYVNSIQGDALHAAAYLLWAVNWIHPFYDGNGRVSRELSYLGLLVHLRLSELPGYPTIPQLIDQRYHDEYYQGLTDADRAPLFEPDVRQLESLLSNLVVEQIESATIDEESGSNS